jgi:predicted glycosyltransferase
MNIWFDLHNSPHINMFRELIADLQADHEIIITARALANTVDLLELHRLEYSIVGRHYGASTLRKVMGYPERVRDLHRFLRDRSIDLAVSQSSFYSPVVARLLGAPSIYLNDNEHALGNVPAFLFADIILLPEFLSLERVRWQGARAAKVRHFPGIKEGLYLWSFAEQFMSRRSDNASRGGRKMVYLRPEPWTAQYYKGSVHFLDNLLLGLRDHVQLTVLPRGRLQGEHYKDPKFEGIRVVDTALDLREIAPDCDLFIGAGGTMTREMAVLGIPTISIYQAELLEVDRYLLRVGCMEHRPELDAPTALKILERASQRGPNSELLDKGKAAYELLRRTILERGADPHGKKHL